MTQIENTNQGTTQNQTIKSIATRTKQQPIFSATLKIVLITTCLITLFLFILIFSGSYFGYRVYHNIAAQNKALELKTTELTTAQTQMQQSQQALQTVINQVRQNSNMSYYLNMLATTDQLVMAANLALTAENNQAKALALLNNAHRRLNNIHDFFAITQALESDMINIQNTRVLNTEKITLQLNKLAQQINALTQALAPSLASAKTQDKTAQNHSATTPLQSLWHKALNNISSTLQHAVTISRRENVPSALTSSQLTNLKLNIQALFLGASWAANHHQNKTYQTNLKEAINLLQNYFPANEDVKNDIIPAIQELAQIDVTAPTLSLDKTLDLIETILEQKSAADITDSTQQ